MKRWMSSACSILVLAIMLFSGCESGDDGGGIADGHDFGSNSPDVYLAMGDSITRGYAASVPYPAVLSSMLDKSVINRGVDGARTSEGLSRVYSLIRQHRPGYLLILYGANDIIHDADPGMVAEQLRGIIRAAKASQVIPVIATCTPQIYGHSIFNGGIVALNSRIRSLGSEEGIKVVDLEAAFSGHDEYLTKDGLHPNNTGHAVIAAEFFDILH